MGDSEANYLDLFSSWLRTLGDDAEQLGELVAEEQVPAGARQAIAGGINYLFKSLDLIPDGIDDIGYLDDAFVLRITALLASQEIEPGVEARGLGTLKRLAGDCEVMREFLMDRDYDRLQAYVTGLRRGASRGRSAADIVDDGPTREQFLSDLRGFARSFEPPGFSRESKNLIKLRAFFDAKLPQ
jgi:uncharacterized membrane protein YkvA (DUF1232 family)